MIKAKSAALKLKKALCNSSQFLCHILIYRQFDSYVNLVKLYTPFKTQKKNYICDSVRGINEHF